MQMRRRLECKYISERSAFPRDLELCKFGKEFAAKEKTRDDLRVRERACERVVRRGLFGNAAVVEDRIEIERGAIADDGLLYAVLYHMHVTERVRVYRAIGKLPIGMPRALRRGFEKIAVEGHVLPRERPLFEPVAPMQKSVDEDALALLLLVRHLFPAESVDRERLVHDVRAVPHAAFFVETVGRICKVQGTHRHDGMFEGFCSRSFYVND